MSTEAPSAPCLYPDLKGIPPSEGPLIPTYQPAPAFAPGYVPGNPIPPTSSGSTIYASLSIQEQPKNTETLRKVEDLTNRGYFTRFVLWITGVETGEDLQPTVASLAKEVAELKEKYAKAESRAKQFEECNTTLLRERDAANKIFEEDRKEYLRQRSSFSELQQRLDAAEKERSAIDFQFKQAAQQLKEALETLEKEKGIRTSQTEGTLQAREKSLQQIIADLKERSERLAKQIGCLETELLEKKRKIQELDKSLEQSRATIQLFKESLALRDQALQKELTGRALMFELLKQFEAGKRDGKAEHV